MNHAAKPWLSGIAAAGGGFYVGGRYVGGLAQATYQFNKPDWISQAQQTMWIVLALACVCAVLWLVVDWLEVETA